MESGEFLYVLCWSTSGTPLAPQASLKPPRGLSPAVSSHVALSSLPRTTSEQF